MRSSNIILSSSAAIILCVAVGYGIYTFAGGAGADNDRNANNPNGVKSDAQNDTGSNDDESEQLRTKLAKSTAVLEKKDDRIFELTNQLAQANQQLTTASLIPNEFAEKLGCEANEVTAVLDNRLQELSALKLELSATQQTLADRQKRIDGLIAQLNSDSENKTPQPLIKPFSDPSKPQQMANNTKKEEIQNSADATSTTSQSPETASEKSTRAVLLNEVRNLRAELMNREKLLFEQTSLIEDLKKKTRFETTFRTGNNTESGSGNPVTTGPFRDLGTFKKLPNP